MTEVVIKTGRATSGPIMARTSVPIILVVDDDADTRTLLRYVLESQRYQVTEAIDGIEAVRVAETVLPDLILMDTTLQNMNGLEATRHIRSTNCTRNIPIVFLSGHAQPQARDVALASGANDYLVKPFSLDVLEKVVEHQLSNSRQKGEQSSPGFLINEGGLL